VSENPYESPSTAGNKTDEPAAWSRSRLGLAVICSGAALLLVVSICLWIADPARKTATDFANLGVGLLWLIGFATMVWELIRRRAGLVLVGFAIFGAGAVIQIVVIVASGMA
jgi:hypothetical protein